MNNMPKFRVWSRPDNKFLPINSDEYELSFHGDVWLVKKLCQTFEEQLKNTHVVDGVNYVMQQAVSVQAACETDIYIGDIVSHNSEPSIMTVVRTTKEGEDNHPGYCLCDLFTQYGPITIRGNIFQNPELLEK